MVTIPGTKELLSQSLLGKLEKKPLNRITVNELVQDCGISRMTFYYHFSDIYDLARWSFDHEVRRILRGRTSSQTWKDDMGGLLEAVQLGEARLRNVYQHVDQVQLELFLRKEMCLLLRPIVDDLAEGLRLSEEGKDRVVSFYSWAALGMVYDWYRADMPATPRQMVSDTAVLTRGVLRQSLESASRAMW